MQFISDIQKTREICQQWRNKGETIAFVPTMGCLHQGHISLVKKAKLLADHVVVSIFVNPLQFSENEDFSSYPRIIEQDQLTLTEYSPELVFVPESSEFYPEGEKKVNKIELEKIKLGELTHILEGANRPDHFTGVATVVKRLFDIVMPNTAIFGEKDFQQLILIKSLVKYFTLDIKIIGMPIFREDDGLAMSSRNRYLNPQQRKKAPLLYKTLNDIKNALNQGRHDYVEILNEGKQELEKSGFELNYISIRESESLAEVQSSDSDKVVLIAAKLGNIRLIDNLRV